MAEIKKRKRKIARNRRPFASCTSQTIKSFEVMFVCILCESPQFWIIYAVWFIMCKRASKEIIRIISSILVWRRYEIKLFTFYKVAVVLLKRLNSHWLYINVAETYRVCVKLLCHLITVHSMLFYACRQSLIASKTNLTQERRFIVESPAN